MTAWTYNLILFQMKKTCRNFDDPKAAKSRETVNQTEKFYRKLEIIVQVKGIILIFIPVYYYSVEKGRNFWSETILSSVLMGSRMVLVVRAN